MSDVPRWKRPLVKLAATRTGSRWFLGPANRIDPLAGAGHERSPEPLSRLPDLRDRDCRREERARARIPLKYATDGDDLVVIASAGGAPKHPAWFHNVRKNPDTRVWANRGRSGDYVARVAEGEERQRKWARAVALYPGYETYRERAGGREIPVIALSPRG